MNIELRDYQKNIIKSILDHGNTLVVLPTGTGKTIIGFVVLVKKGGGAFLAPTKPLVTQHYKNFIKLYPSLKEKTFLLTGEVKDRGYYKKAKFIFATPQTIEKNIDFFSDLFKLPVFIFDEAHRAVGEYSYVILSNKFFELNREGLVIGLTASPGGSKEKINEVIKNLRIENVEIRTGNEEDIKEFVFTKNNKWFFVELDEELRKVIDLISRLIKKERDWFKERGFKISLNKKELISFFDKIKNLGNLSYQASSHYSILFMLTFMKEILETQGFGYFLSYVEKIKKKKSKAVNYLFSSSLFREVLEIANKNKEKLHPKFFKLKELLLRNKNKKVIVFFQYVDSIERAYNFLKDSGFTVFKFVGKRKGFTKKKQEEVLNEFREKGGVLLSSSVGEEGIDIPYVDVVIFFDVVPSEIRSIQRKGRTGRFREGEVYYIITSSTLEIAFYRAAVKKEKLMKKQLKALSLEKPKNKETKISYSKDVIDISKNKKGQYKITDFY